MTLKIKGDSPKISLAILVATATIGIMPFIALSGCSAGTRTLVDPANTDATHTTRIERAGHTKTRETELIIEPSSSRGSPDSSKSHSSQHIPAQYHRARANKSLRVQPAMSSPAVLIPSGQVSTVGWQVKQGDSIDPTIDPAMLEAIREAAGNGQTVKFKVTESEEIPMSADVIDSTLTDTGASLNTHSDEAAIAFDGKKSGANLPFGGKSGKTSWGLDASLFSSGVNVMHIMGAIVMLGAVVPLWAPPRRWGAAGVVVGVGLLIIAAGTVSEQAPWVFVLAIIGFMGLAGWLGYESWRNKRRGVALASVVRGVEISALQAKQSVKDKIELVSGDNINIVRSEVRSMKNKTGVASKSIHT